ncbi:hypothetical protein K227x_04100 [Rubripirellula lacrimiformis]|uniref:YetF C-terminal domain-containing protein n=1 Tax=Rubripirellula lacrimiformis TaxID=1930273 RepID=A0A517N4I2_9BACT|nr:YetF domain-containing protein [Rubripirellula lacrimiformis]QDT02039.1 hypothetical protein K227x_04100 [Rubripirellula lacrimiformis]
MFEKWISASTGQLFMVLVSSVVVYAAILLYTRLAGLRSFSKMSAADFAMTIAVGSLFGATVSAPSPTLFVGLFSLLCLFAAQWALASLRRKSDRFSKLVDNQPLLLMVDGEIIQQNLEQANMTESDLFGKLREANALNFDQVKAVVFETTGDVSVLHNADDNIKLEPRFFEGVIGADRLFP